MAEPGYENQLFLPAFLVAAGAFFAVTLAASFLAVDLIADGVFLAVSLTAAFLEVVPFVAAGALEAEVFEAAAALVATPAGALLVAVLLPGAFALAALAVVFLAAAVVGELLAVDNDLLADRADVFFPPLVAPPRPRRSTPDSLSTPWTKP
jgi:hypothetical protein